MKGNQPIYPVERYITIGEKKVLFGGGSTKRKQSRTASFAGIEIKDASAEE